MQMSSSSDKSYRKRADEAFNVINSLATEKSTGLLDIKTETKPFQFFGRSVTLTQPGNWLLRKMRDSLVGTIAKPWRNLCSLMRGPSSGDVDKSSAGFQEAVSAQSAPPTVQKKFASNIEYAEMKKSAKIWFKKRTIDDELKERGLSQPGEQQKLDPEKQKNLKDYLATTEREVETNKKYLNEYGVGILPEGRAVTENDSKEQGGTYNWFDPRKEDWTEPTKRDEIKTQIKSELDAILLD